MLNGSELHYICLRYIIGGQNAGSPCTTSSELMLSPYSGAASSPSTPWTNNMASSSQSSSVGTHDFLFSHASGGAGSSGGGGGSSERSSGDRALPFSLTPHPASVWSSSYAAASAHYNDSTGWLMHQSKRHLMHLLMFSVFIFCIIYSYCG